MLATGLLVMYSIYDVKKLHTKNAYMSRYISLYVYMYWKINKYPEKFSSMSHNWSENVWHVWEHVENQLSAAINSCRPFKYSAAFTLKASAMQYFP